MNHSHVCIARADVCASRQIDVGDIANAGGGTVTQVLELEDGITMKVYTKLLEIEGEKVTKSKASAHGGDAPTKEKSNKSASKPKDHDNEGHAREKHRHEDVNQDEYTVVRSPNRLGTELHEGASTTRGAYDDERKEEEEEEERQHQTEDEKEDEQTEDEKEDEQTEDEKEDEEEDEDDLLAAAAAAVIEKEKDRPKPKSSFPERLGGIGRASSLSRSPPPPQPQPERQLKRAPTAPTARDDYMITPPRSPGLGKSKQSALGTTTPKRPESQAATPNIKQQPPMSPPPIQQHQQPQQQASRMQSPPVTPLNVVQQQALLNQHKNYAGSETPSSTTLASPVLRAELNPVDSLATTPMSTGPSTPMSGGSILIQEALGAPVEMSETPMSAQFTQTLASLKVKAQLRLEVPAQGTF